MYKLYESKYEYKIDFNPNVLNILIAVGVINEENKIIFDSDESKEKCKNDIRKHEDFRGEDKIECLFLIRGMKVGTSYLVVK